jgi:short-subunit dehydrogenase
MKLDNKRIVLTGASSGIGEALLEKLLEYDVKILVGDLTPNKVKKAKGKVFAVKCDVSQKAQVDALFKTAKKELGGIDLFIANAGFAYYEKIGKEDWNHIDKIFSTNFISPVYAAEKMATFNKDGEYTVVITASAMAKLAMPGYTLYSATKAALDSFASGYRHEKDKGATISIVYPIATRTKFFDVAAKGTPIPFPTQTPEKVARAIISGIKRNRKSRV